MEDLLVSADYVVHEVRQSLRGQQWLKNVPPLLKRLIKENLWQERRIEQTGDVVRFDHFEDFVTTPPLEGLGATVDMLVDVCRMWNDDETESLVLGAAKREEGGANNPWGRNGKPHEEITDNIIISDKPRRRSPTGTTKAATLMRLEREDPELHAQVVAGKLKSNAAALQAGLRPHKIAVNLASAESAAATLKRHADQDFIVRLIELLGED